MPKQKWTNTSSVSNRNSLAGDVVGSDTTTDSDTTVEEDFSSSGTEEETEPKSFLDRVLTAERPWSTNGRWKKIIQEANIEKVHRMALNSKDLRKIVVVELNLLLNQIVLLLSTLILDQLKVQIT